MPLARARFKAELAKKEDRACNAAGWEHLLGGRVRSYMTTSGLAAPRRASPPSLPRPGRTTPVPSRPPPTRRSSFEKVLGWSVAASFGIHLLLLLLSPLVITMERPGDESEAQTAVSPEVFGMEMVVPIPSENAPENPVAEEAAESPPTFAPPPVSRQAPAATGAPATPPAGPQAPAGPTARESLQPGYRDSRLYVTPSPLPPPDTRTEHERYMEHLQARIDAVNDSMSVAANRERRTSDWTVTDGSGNRWGLSPDGLHLGGVTVPRALLPLPGATGDNQQLGEQRERDRQREEIRGQEDAAERRRIQDERIEATRQQQRR
jgi:hypothetical protein